MVSSYRLIARVAFEHAYFTDGQLRCLHIVPVTACGDILRRAGLLLRHLDDGFAIFGDDTAFERLRMHVADAREGLGMLFQVFVTDPHFYDYTAPAWPTGELLYLDTACAVGAADGSRTLHETPAVTADAFVARDGAHMETLLGKRALAPQPAMVVRITLSYALLDESDDSRRVFRLRFESASTRWKYCVFGLDAGEATVVDLAGNMEFDHYPGVQVADGRRADVFLSCSEIPMRNVPEARFQLRMAGPDGDKVIVKRMPNASVGKRFREFKDGNEILVSEVFINP